MSDLLLNNCNYDHNKHPLKEAKAIRIQHFNEILRICNCIDMDLTKHC